MKSIMKWKIFTKLFTEMTNTLMFRFFFSFLVKKFCGNAWVVGGSESIGEHIPTINFKKEVTPNTSLRSNWWTSQQCFWWCTQLLIIYFGFSFQTLYAKHTIPAFCLSNEYHHSFRSSSTFSLKYKIIFSSLQKMNWRKILY